MLDELRKQERLKQLQNIERH